METEVQDSNPQMPAGAVAMVEKDSNEAEDMTLPEIMAFLIPSDEILEKAELYNMAYNRRLFHGWVKQPGPCCGAAVVAAGWNALNGLHRNDSQAMNHQHVLDQYILLFQDMITERKESLARKLGGNSIDDFLDDIRQELQVRSLMDSLSSDNEW